MGHGLQRAANATHRTRTASPTHAVGQRWADCDKRYEGRRELLIVAMLNEGTRARCSVYLDGVATGRFVTVACARLVPKSTGYRYVGDGAPAAASPAKKQGR